VRLFSLYGISSFVLKYVKFFEFISSSFTNRAIERLVSVVRYTSVYSVRTSLTDESAVIYVFRHRYMGFTSDVRESDV